MTNREFNNTSCVCFLPAQPWWSSAALSLCGSTTGCQTVGPQWSEEAGRTTSPSAGWSSSLEPSVGDVEMIIFNRVVGKKVRGRRCWWFYLSVPVALGEAASHHVRDAQGFHTQQVEDHCVGESELGVQDSRLPLRHNNFKIDVYVNERRDWWLVQNDEKMQVWLPAYKRKGMTKYYSRQLSITCWFKIKLIQLN